MSDQSIFRGTIVAFLGQGVGRAFKYALYVLIARILGLDALGAFSFGLMVISIGGLFSKVGLDVAAQRFIPKFRSDNDDRSLSGLAFLGLFTPLVVGSLIAMALIALRPQFAGLLPPNIGALLPMFAVGIPLWGVFIVVTGMTRAYKTSLYSVLSRDVVQAGTAVLLTGIFAWTVREAEVVVASYILSIGIGTAVAVGFLYRLGAFAAIRQARVDVRRVFTFSTPMAVVAVAQSMITWTDVLMLGVLEQAADIGRYQAAFQIAALLTIVLRATNAIFPPIASDLFASNAISELSQVYTAVTKWTVTVSGLGLVFLVVFSNPLLTVFGDELTESSRLLVVLGVGQFVTVATGPVGYLLSMSGREQIESANTLVVFLLNGVLNFVMIVEYGPLGAAVATAFSLVVLNLLRVFELHLLSEISIQSETYTNAFGALVIGSTILVVGRFFAGTSLLVAFLTGGVAFLAFCAAVFVQGFTKTDESLFESL